MLRCERLLLAAALGGSIALGCQAQCGFKAKPVAEQRWYRADGWETPGVSDAKWVTKVNVTLNGKPAALTLPEGITFAIGWHERSYHVIFPATVFRLNDEAMRMGPRTFELHGLTRWEMDGKVYAYSYVLAPPELACMFSMDLIDDKGDGKFRWMMPDGGHPFMGQNPEPPPVPEWAARKPGL